MPVKNKQKMEKRIKVKLKDANPLFKQWLNEWIDEAEKKRKKSSKTYKKALNSLEKYPLPLWSGHDCAILEGFGEKICSMIEEKWQKHLMECRDIDRSLCFKDKITELQRRHMEEVQDILANIEAINLVEESALNHENLSAITEEDLEVIVEDNQENIQPEHDESSDDSIDRLIKKYNPPKKTEVASDSPVSSKPKSRVLKKFKSFNVPSSVAGPSFASSPVTSRLIDVQRSPKRLKSNDLDDNFSPIVPEKRRRINDKKDNDQALLSPVKFSHPEEKDDGRKYISVDDINPSDFEVILLIDIGEAKSKEKCEIKTKIARQNIKSEVRKLHIGDFTWIAKHKTQNEELVLPYIIERKRLDDLASSIKDNRFHEQKFRLKQCGIENVIYLIESMRANSFGLPFETLTQAVSNTLIQNRFQVKVTDNSDHTVMYLAMMTSFISQIFSNKQPIKFKLLDFDTFNQGSIKQKKLTVRETFIKQLLALKGLSVDAAIEITKYYPTPSHLYDKYLTLSQSDGEILLTKITLGELKRKIPAPASKVIYHFYMRK